MGALPRRAWRISAIEFTRKISPPPNSCHSLGVQWATVAWEGLSMSDSVELPLMHWFWLTALSGIVSNIG